MQYDALCYVAIWLMQYHMHDWKTIVLIEEFFNCPKILYNQHDCHDWPSDLKRFYGIAKLSPWWATRFQSWRDSWKGGTDIKERNILEEKILISYQKKQTMFCIDAESKCVWYQLCVKKEWNFLEHVWTSTWKYR